MPEEKPLESFVALQLVGKAKDILLVVGFQEVEQLRARLHDAERRALGVVNKDWDAS